MNKQQVARLRRAVRRLVLAEVDYSWRGSGDAETIEWATKELRAARKAYNKLIEELTDAVTTQG